MRQGWWRVGRASIALVAVAFGLWIGAVPAEAVTFTVNSTADSNDGSCTASDCTLREAIDAVNASGGSINFAISGSPPHTIRPTSPLPAITRTTTIDALPSCLGAHQIEIDGSLAGDADGLRFTSEENFVRGLVIGGFDSPGRAGLRFEAAPQFDFFADSLQCSLVGTDASGQGGNPNHYGVVLAGRYAVVTNSNVISGNDAAGVLLTTGARRNNISGNKIGTNLAGAAALPNAVGVLINGATNYVSSNTISGNGKGVEIRTVSSYASHNQVFANRIGIDHAGTGALPNLTSGVLLAAPDNRVGSGNTIAFNGGAGVRVESGWGNNIFANQMFDNGGLGIELELPLGPNPNDPGDPDLGPNRRQNYPVLGTAVAGDGRTDITGTLDSTANTDFTIRVYRSDACDPSGYGEGREQIATKTVRTDGSGLASFNAVLNSELPAASVVTATATASVSPSPFDTSEFSQCITSTSIPTADLTFTVNSTADTNDGFCTVSNCTLREAIERANNRPGVDTITFGISGSPPHVIRPTSPLPTVVERATVDALPNCTGAQQIVIDGSLAGDTDGLRISTALGGTVVRGLAIGGFDAPGRAGVRLEPGPSAAVPLNTVECSRLGTDATGQAPNPNHHGVVFASNFGSVTRASVISGNNSHGVLFANGSGTNTIADSFIGTDASGTAPLGNGADGVHDANPSSNSASVTASVISGNLGDGVEASGFGFSVSQSKIGTDGGGNADLSNGEAGVEVSGAGITISGNTIAGHELAGVLVRTGSFGSVMSANRIGTNHAGTSAIPNGVGVLISGETNTLSGNTISGNGTGIEIRTIGSSLARRHRIGDNRIGTNAAGDAALPNLASGILIAGTDNTVGGDVGANRIAFNGGAGVRVESGWGNGITGNRIYDNGGLGIDLEPLGPTPNDAGDSDLGPNRRQNHPVLTAATVTEAGTEISGTLDSTASKSFTIRVYTNAACDPSGYGEGETPVAAKAIATDSSGQANFVVNLSSQLAEGTVVTATATATNLNPSPNDTSEFSQCIATELPDALVVNSAADSDDGSCTASDCTLREAIEAANGRSGIDEITFAIPGSAPHVIQPNSALPAIVERATIDALPDCSGSHQIVIDGSQAGDADGLRIATAAGGTVVRGLVIGGFDSPERAGARFEAGPSSIADPLNAVECSLLGTAAGGQSANPNHFGVVFAAPLGKVRRSSVISGNASHGALFAAGADTNSISDSFIGTNASGNSALGNGADGVHDVAQQTNNVAQVSASVISANAGDGVEATGSFAVSQSKIGTDAVGTTDLSNGESGVEVAGRAVAVSQNTISGHESAGVWIRVSANLNTVSGNRVGTNHAGTAAIGNGVGVLVNGENNLLNANTISGNGTGIEIRTVGSTLARRNKIGLNRIGTNAAGDAAVPNLASGILIAGTDNRIGHEYGFNTIAFNGGAGVRVEGGWGNDITRNRIYDNGGLGIDLEPVGLTANDPGDPDLGANRRQNHPVLTVASGTTINGTLDSSANSSFTIYLYTNGACDPSGYGEGRDLLASKAITTDGAGHSSFSFNLSSPVGAGTVITATATRTAVSPSPNDTSEFSQCIESMAP